AGCRGGRQRRRLPPAAGVCRPPTPPPGALRRDRTPPALAATERACFYWWVAKVMSKGAETRELALREALRQASVVGLNGLTIGTLADRLEMSKSGLFAHFRSKSRLQIETLDFAADRFRLHVVLPALREPEIGRARARSSSAGRGGTPAPSARGP